LESLLIQHNIHWESNSNQDEKMIWEKMKSWIQSSIESDENKNLSLPLGWENIITKMLKLPNEALFPVLDILRLLMFSPIVQKYYADPQSKVCFSFLFLC